MNLPTTNITPQRKRQLNTMRDDVLMFVRQHVTALNIVFTALVFAGLTIVQQPDIYAASMVERTLGISGEMYGAGMAVIGALALASDKSKVVIVWGILPLWLHTGWSMIYALESINNLVGLPIPFYIALSIIGTLELLGNDDGNH